MDASKLYQQLMGKLPIFSLKTKSEKFFLSEFCKKIMVRKVSKKSGYINRIIENVCSIKENELNAIYDDLKSADCIILLGEGRSQSALYIGMGQINKEVRVVTDIDFPGRNIEEAAPVLEKKYKKIALLVNSGSGETTIPRQVVKQLSDYIERRKTDKFSIDAVVSNMNSSIGRMSEKDFVNIVKLKGRERKANSTNAFLKHGIMNDVYELGSLLLFQKTKEALNERSAGLSADADIIIEKIKEEAKLIGDFVDRFVSSDSYECIINKMETRSRVTIGGFGPARNVAKMSAIRLQHIKRAIGDDAYLAGPFAPRARAGDILILVSWSGETGPVLEWCSEHKASGGYVYSVVGNESSLSKASDSMIIDSPSVNFYERAAFVLSPLPLHLVERLNQRGFKLPEYIMRWWEHSPY